MNEPSAAAALVGTQIAGKYRLTRLLGEGGMGAVYLGEQKLGDASKQVAVKVLHKEIASDPKVRARFERECGIVAQLHHPNTIQVFDFGSSDDGSLYIVMEFVEGRSVATVLEKDGALAPERVKKILDQVTGSLEEAHSRGIVHRDLKPDNVVLCERPGQRDWVEVLDFGIAKRSSESDPNEQKLTMMGMVLGTPPYMSPEQFTGQPIDARSDIYALGVMTYEMLTARLPFNGNTPYEWATQHMTAQPMPFEMTPNGAAIPLAMKAAILRAMEKRPDARFASVREFFEAFSSDAPATVQSPPPAFDNGPRAGGTQVGPAVTPMGAAAIPYPGGHHPTPGPMSGYGAPQGQGGYGAPPGPGYGAPMGAPAQGYGAPAPGYAQPASPPSRPQSGGGKGIFIGIGAVILIGGGAAIAYATGAFGSKSPDPVVAANTVSTPETVVIPTGTAVPTATTPEGTSAGPLPGLNNGGTSTTTGTTATKPTTTGTATTKPTTTTTTGAPTTIPPPPPPPVTAQPTVVPPPPPPATTTPTVAADTARICAEAATACSNPNVATNARMRQTCQAKQRACALRQGAAH